MAARAMAQDIIVCDMCETSPVQMHCNTCAVNLCNGCVIKHIAADTVKYHHDVVLYKKRNTKPIFPKCKTHKEQNCEMKCQQCDTPVCVKCLASGSHIKHSLLDLLDLINSRKDVIKQNIIELETSTYPKYESAVCELELQLQNLPKTYDRLMSDISNHGNEWHREVDIVINRRKQDAQKMKSDDMTTLTKLLEQMKNLLSALRQAIVDNYELLHSNNVVEVLDSEFKSAEIWSPPPSIDVTPPTFKPLPLQGEQLHQMFGTVTAASIPRQVISTKLVEDKLVTAVKQLQLLDSPESPSSVQTGYGYHENITFLSPGQVWASGHGNTIKRFSAHGLLQETITTKTGNWPSGLTVTNNGDLIYTDRRDRSINRVRDGKIETVISLPHDWVPRRVCCTALDELVVAMTRSSTPTRVVRFSGSTEKQVIQFDDQGKPLFSSDNYNLFIAERSDKDMICVSDPEANEVVVVNLAGKFRFRYTGDTAIKKYKFCPHGVVVDSVGHILVADYNNHCIHIIDQQGSFIRCLNNIRLLYPYDLSLDKNNTLYVAEFTSSTVKFINYLK